MDSGLATIRSRVYLYLGFTRDRHYNDAHIGNSRCAVAPRNDQAAHMIGFRIVYPAAFRPSGRTVFGIFRN
jgi:hypothetical protein